MDNRAIRRDLKRKASALLSKAEAWYGKRDTTWTFTEVTFSPKGPHLYYPPGKDKLVEIQLMTGAVGDQALYQLSHEIVHLLAPVRQPPATMLEEGLAVKFSLDAPIYSNRAYKIAALEDLKTTVNYGDAYNLVTELLASVPNAIKKLRSKEPNFFVMTPDFIIEALGVNADLATHLTEKRDMR